MDFVKWSAVVFFSLTHLQIQPWPSWTLWPGIVEQGRGSVISHRSMARVCRQRCRWSMGSVIELVCWLAEGLTKLA